MKFLFFTFLILCFTTSHYCLAQRLQATKITSGGVYRLESQHDGAFLTAFGDGKVGSSQSSAETNRQWTFQQNGDSSWTLTPVINDINVVSEQTWKITYVGHGKSQFQSLSTGKCLLNSSGPNVLNGSCDKQDPRQRWRVA